MLVLFLNSLKANIVKTIRHHRNVDKKIKKTEMQFQIKVKENEEKKVEIA